MGTGVFKRMSNVLGQLDRKLGEKYEAEEGLTLETLLEEIGKSKMYCKDVLMKPRHSKTGQRFAIPHTHALAAASLEVVAHAVQNIILNRM